MDETNAGRIREFFGRFFNPAELLDNDDIFAKGYVNSLFAMQLIAWLEKDFSLTVEDGDLELRNFNSLSSISSFISRKQASGDLTKV